QDNPGSDKKAAAEPAAPNSPASTNSPAAGQGQTTVDAEKNPGSTNRDSQSKAEKVAATDEIQVSFQGANIDMIVQWLAQTTGKSVEKHPQVQCQLTIMSSKKVPPREAISLVYRAMALEGFTAVESSNAILIVPEGKEPKLNPELIDAG